MYNFTNYIIMYDVSDARSASKMLSILRGYCNHLQNSIFEGKLKKSELMELLEKIKEVIDLERDSVIVYPISYLNILNKVTLGRPRYKRSPIF